MKIAIIGTGIAGNLAAYRLAPNHDITVYESDSRIGGHTNTLDVALDGKIWPVDTGFIVYNDLTYPNFIALMDELGVESQASDMSFSVSSQRDGLEYNGASLNALFAQRSNLLKPSFYRMLADILRFNREAPLLLDTPANDITLGEYLDSNGYSRQFIEHYIVPMGSAIWSATAERMRAAPAMFFVRFFQNHGLLSVSDRPTWRVIKGGSRQYVEKLVIATASASMRRCSASAGTRRPSKFGPLAVSRNFMTAYSWPATATRPCGCWPTPRRLSGMCSARSNTRTTRPFYTPTTA